MPFGMPLLIEHPLQTGPRYKGFDCSSMGEGGASQGTHRGRVLAPVPNSIGRMQEAGG